MKKVTVTFVGDGSDEVAQAFYTYFVDGGLEDQIIDTLTDNTAANIEVEGIMDINNDTLDIAIQSKMTP
ncbi:MAG: hypothetical protein GY767_14800 [Shimia sp.]|uniref:hypothetical protein n=1 Tax=Shimia sp. TaxID=1954381 RepID=UPI001B2D5CF5|nr:hypothetical protein [Shimia sp.]MBO6896939.1 hypothetical protein [Shimia sp.]MCP4208305.1 hypothetical protein [Shimia sp.]MCP4825858.1 hypothetical protein [Shimia sp.]MEC8195393.1 hypothetical protein [Pseudomonadota bacterium]